MTSRLAKILFIADSVGNANYFPGAFSFRGSNPQEQKQIEIIRREFAPYLYAPEKAPKKLIDKLGPVAEKLIADTPGGEDLAAMYEYK